MKTSALFLTKIQKSILDMLWNHQELQEKQKLIWWSTQKLATEVSQMGQKPTKYRTKIISLVGIQVDVVLRPENKESTPLTY